MLRSLVGGGCFLSVLTLIGGLWAVRLRIGQGLLCGRGRGLSTVNRRARYGRLQGEGGGKTQYRG